MRRIVPSLRLRCVMCVFYVRVICDLYVIDYHLHCIAATAATTDDRM